MDRRRAGAPDWRDVRVHVGAHAWRRARNSARAVCVPPDTDWRSYDWCFLRGAGVTVIAWDMPYADVDALARHLVIAGAELVFAVGHGPGGTRHRGASYVPRVRP